MDVRRTSPLQPQPPNHKKPVLSLSERVALAARAAAYFDPATWVPGAGNTRQASTAFILLCTNFPKIVARIEHLGFASVFVPRTLSTDCVECLFSIMRSKRPTFSATEAFDMLAVVQRLEAQVSGGLTTAGYVYHSTRKTNYVAPLSDDE